MPLVSEIILATHFACVTMISFLSYFGAVHVGNYSEESVRYRRQRYGPMFKYVLVPGILLLSTLYFANKFSKQGPPPKVQTVEAWYNTR